MVEPERSEPCPNHPPDGTPCPKCGEYHADSERVPSKCPECGAPGYTKAGCQECGR